MGKSLSYLLVPAFVWLLIIGGFSGFWALSKPPREEVGYYEYMDLWLGVPDVRDEPYEAFWMQGAEGYDEESEWMTTIRRVWDLYQNGSSPALRSMMYFPIPDYRGSSIYLLVEASANRSEILEVVDAPPEVSVRFIEAPASREMTYRWLRRLWDIQDALRFSGVRVGGLGLTVNGTFLVELEEVSPRSVRAVLMAVDGYVPPGMLVIRRTGSGLYV